MFDSLFGGVSSEDINRSNQAHAINAIAIMIVMVDKGLVTDEELMAARVKATQYVDQEWARKREESEKEFDEKHPGLRKTLDSLLGPHVK